jgi:aspartate-semialdehyde dehydrogenase
VTAVRIPTFAGCGIQLSVETERPLSAQEAADTLSKTPGIVVSDEPGAPNTRGSIGSSDVGVGRVRPDPSAPEGHGLRLWLAGDPVRLAALNGLELARERFFSTGT